MPQGQLLVAVSRVRRSSDLSLSDFPSQRSLNPNKLFTALTVREMTRLSVLCEATLARHAALMHGLPVPDLPELARFHSLAVPEVAMASRIRSYGLQTNVPLTALDIKSPFPHGALECSSAALCTHTHRSPCTDGLAIYDDHLYAACLLACRDRRHTCAVSYPTTAQLLAQTLPDLLAHHPLDIQLQFLPCFSNNHWTLGILNFESRTLSWLDSMGPAQLAPKRALRSIRTSCTGYGWETSYCP